MGSLGADVLMFHFMYLVVGVYPRPGAGAPGQPAGNAGLLRRLLRVQLGPRPAELLPGFIGPGLCLLCCLSLLFLWPSGPFFAGACFVLRLFCFILGWLPFAAQPLRGPRPVIVLPELAALGGLRANLARSVRPRAVRLSLVFKAQARRRPRRFSLLSGCRLFLSGGLRARLARRIRFFLRRLLYKIRDRIHLLSPKMKCASQYLWTLNWHTSLLNCGCGIGT